MGLSPTIKKGERRARCGQPAGQHRQSEQAPEGHPGPTTACFGNSFLPLWAGKWASFTAAASRCCNPHESDLETGLCTARGPRVVFVIVQSPLHVGGCPPWSSRKAPCPFRSAGNDVWGGTSVRSVKAALSRLRIRRVSIRPEARGRLASRSLTQGAHRRRRRFECPVLQIELR